jgi:hypothetical protein
MPNRFICKKNKKYISFPRPLILVLDRFVTGRRPSPQVSWRIFSFYILRSEAASKILDYVCRGKESKIVFHLCCGNQLLKKWKPKAFLFLGNTVHRCEKESQKISAKCSFNYPSSNFILIFNRLSLGSF